MYICVELVDCYTPGELKEKNNGIGAVRLVTQSLEHRRFREGLSGIIGIGIPENISAVS